MDKLELQKLRDLPIEGVAERLGLRVSRHKSLCPFHTDHHASMSYHVRKNTCRCFVCMNESLGPIDLVMRHLRMGFVEACRWLANENNIILEEWQVKKVEVVPQRVFDAGRYARYFEHPWLSDAARAFLFDERRLDERVVRWCRLTSWRDRHGVDWLQIPYYNMRGELIGVQNRNLCRGAQPRFRFPSGTNCSIYNLPVLGMLREGEALYITEGASDCWAMLSAGHKAIAIPSATLLKPADMEVFRLLEPLHVSYHMFPDRDAPGERLFLQLQGLLPGLIHHQLPPDCKDFGDYYRLRIKRDRG